MRRLLTLSGLITAFSMGVAPMTAATPEAEFLKANTAVMNRMMAGMTVKPTGQIDADFVDMMEPHHQGAIEMAEIELRYGRNGRLRRIAQEIIVDQQQEIAAMQLAIGRPLPRSAPAPTGEAGTSEAAMSAMDMSSQHNASEPKEH